jgi:hypothetical protein
LGVISKNIIKAVWIRPIGRLDSQLCISENDIESNEREHEISRHGIFSFPELQKILSPSCLPCQAIREGEHLRIFSDEQEKELAGLI